MTPLSIYNEQHDGDDGSPSDVPQHSPLFSNASKGWEDHIKMMCHNAWVEMAGMAQDHTNYRDTKDKSHYIYS